MKTAIPVRYLFSIIPLVILVPYVPAQDASPKISIPNRMVFNVITENKISTKRAKTNDTVKMKLLDPETLDDGTVVPAGANLTGHVVETIAHSAEKPGSRLTIVVDRLEWKNHSVPLHAYIIGQGQLRTKGDAAYDQSCYDTYFKKATMDLETCASQSKVVVSSRQSMLPQNSSLLHDVQLVLIGTPPKGSSLVSKNRDIVIDSNMVLLVRHMVTTEQPSAER